MSRVPFTAEEDRILRSVFPSHGATEVAKHLKDRTVQAVRSRAVYLGITMTHAARCELLKNARSKRSQVSAPRSIVTKTGQRLGLGPHGETFEWGKTAGTKEGLKPVPESVIGLPWATCPRDAATARAVAAMLEKMAQDSPIVKKLGPEAVAFFVSHAKYLRALADRQEQPVAA